MYLTAFLDVHMWLQGSGFCQISHVRSGTRKYMYAYAHTRTHITEGRLLRENPQSTQTQSFRSPSFAFPLLPPCRASVWQTSRSEVEVKSPMHSGHTSAYFAFSQPHSEYRQGDKRTAEVSFYRSKWASEFVNLQVPSEKLANPNENLANPNGSLQFV